MAIEAGSVVIPAACIAAGTAVIFGTVTAAGEAGAWDVLWENGQLVGDILAAELHEFWHPGNDAITHSYRPASIGPSGSGAVAPGPDSVGVEVARSPTQSEAVIRTLAGHRYWLRTTQLRYLDV